VKHVTAPEPTSIERRGLKVQLTWQRVDARHATYLNLELVYGVSGLQSVDNNHSTISIMYKRVVPKVLLRDSGTNVHCLFRTEM
jgi:hypothetical protein